MTIADIGYFDNVSANLSLVQVCSQGGDIKTNSEVLYHPSVNALGTGVKTIISIGGLTNELCEVSMPFALSTMVYLPTSLLFLCLTFMCKYSIMTTMQEFILYVRHINFKSLSCYKRTQTISYSL